MEYRRGVDAHIWQRFWHFNEDCQDYPTGSFAIAKSKPLERVPMPALYLDRARRKLPIH